MAKSFFQYLATYNNESLPNGLKISQSKLKNCQRLKTTWELPKTYFCCRSVKISQNLVTLRFKNPSSQSALQVCIRVNKPVINFDRVAIITTMVSFFNFTEQQQRRATGGQRPARRARIQPRLNIFIHKRAKTEALFRGGWNNGRRILNAMKSKRSLGNNVLKHFWDCSMRTMLEQVRRS